MPPVSGSDALALEEGLERLRDLQGQMLEVQEHALNVEMAVRGRNILEEYRQAELTVILYAESLGGVDVPRRGLPCSVGSAPLNVSGFIFKFNVINGLVADNWNEQPMFVRNVEQVNGSDGVIPSVVRLYVVNEEWADSRIGRVYCSSKENAFKLFLVRVDRKLGVVIRRKSEPLKGSQPCKIESAFQVVNDIPNDEREVNSGSARTRQIVFDDFVASLRIQLDAHHIGVFQGNNPELKVCDVLFGPLNLVPRVCESGHDGNGVIIPPMKVGAQPRSCTILGITALSSATNCSRTRSPVSITS